MSSESKGQEPMSECILKSGSFFSPPVRVEGVILSTFLCETAQDPQLSLATKTFKRLAGSFHGNSWHKYLY